MLDHQTIQDPSGQYFGMNRPYGQDKNQKRVHILLVGDVSSDCRAIESLIAEYQLPFELNSVKTLTEGLAFLQTDPVDVVLVEGLLPDESGLEFIKQAGDVACIAIASLDGLGSSVEIIKASGFDYLIKNDPWTHLKLLPALIDKVLKQKQSQEQIERQQFIINQLSEMVMLLDNNGNVVFANPAVEATLDFLPEELYGRPFGEGQMKDTDRKNELQTWLWYSILTGDESQSHPDRLDLKMERRDGTPIWTAWSFNRLPQGGLICVGRNINRRKTEEERLRQEKIQLEEQVARRTGTLSKLVANLEDTIAGRDQIEAALQNQRDQFQQYLDVTGVMMLALDVAGRITLINKKGCEILGYQDEALTGKNWFEICLPKGEAEFVMAVFNRIITSEIELIEYYENLVQTRTGDHKMIAFHNSIIRDPSGQIRGVLSSGEDITVRKHIEDTLMFLAQHRWVAEGENFFQALARFLAEKLEMDYVCIDRLDGDGLAAQTVAIYFDGKFEDNVAYTLKDTPCGDVVGKTICCFPREVRDMFPKDAVLQEMVAESYVGTTLWNASGQAIGLIAVIGRHPLADPDLAESVLRLVSEPASGELERLRIEAALIEEHNQLAQRVEERTAELSQVNVELAKTARLKDEFLASMSHELRTPLTGILGLTEALQLKIYGDLNEKQATGIYHIEENGRHLLALINDILDLSKIDAGKVELVHRTVSVRDVCQSSLHMIKQSSENKNIHVDLKIDSSIGSFQADERRLKQILVNLLNNAVKFTPEQGSIGLEVVGEANNKLVKFIVWDNGIGINPQDVERLFKPFVQLDASLSRHYEGTGLGLSLVLKLVELHGGGVSVESEPLKGSRFTVVLPWLDSPENESGPAQVQSTAPLVKRKKSPLQSLILLVDDNDLYINILTDLLLSRDYRVIIGRNGEEGIQLAREKKPDLILMDVQMPVLSGIQAAKVIRADDQIKSIPIIALTALAMNGDREKCFQAGMNEYMSKPVSIDQLQKMIEDQLHP